MKQGSFDQETHIKFTEDHLGLAGQNTTGTIKWPAFKQIDETPNAIYLIPGNGTSIFIPKNQFKNTEDWQQVLKIAKEKHGVEVKSFPS